MLLRSLVSGWIKQRARAGAIDAATRSLGVRPKARRDNKEGRQSERPESQRTGPLPPCDVAIVLALAIETGGLCDRLVDPVTTWCQNFVEHAGTWGERGVVLAESGVGRAAAARATADVIALHHPRWVISAGFAGSLCEEVRRGHVVMADRVVDREESELDIGLNVPREALESTAGLHVGRLLTVDKLVGSTAEKRLLGEQHEAIAVDMETHAVARACSEAKVRFLSVRVVTDGIDDELPREVAHLMKQKSLSGKLGAATGALFHRPSSAKDMWQLREQALDASDRLAKFLEGVIPQLD